MLDVHHGNGTEETIRWLSPGLETTEIVTPMGFGTLSAPRYKPWHGIHDAGKLLFLFLLLIVIVHYYFYCQLLLFFVIANYQRYCYCNLVICFHSHHYFVSSLYIYILSVYSLEIFKVIFSLSCYIFSCKNVLNF